MAIHNPVNAFLEMHNIEINQQSQAFVAHSKVREQLSFVNGYDFFEGFDFNDYEFFNEEIQSVSKVELDRFVNHRSGT
jgi:hypothetical protein